MEIGLGVLQQKQVHLAVVQGLADQVGLTQRSGHLLLARKALDLENLARQIQR